jgi:chemotaxis protein methyltransferase CheR
MTSPQNILQRPAGDAPSQLPGEYRLTNADFTRLAAVLREDTGIHLPSWKTSLVYSRLAKRLRALGLKDFASYCNYIEQGAGAEERRYMCAAMTTNVTRFFREPHHFEHLKQTVLPSLLDTARRGGRVRLWSSASSSGEEPYSIALTILSKMPDAASLDIKILATDINPSMVQEGRRGAYSEDSLSSVPVELKKRWFEPVQRNVFEAKSELRSLIEFRELNLIGTWPMRRQFDVVFCRNVAIYFDEETKAQLWQRLAGVIPVGGWFYIGHSERIEGPAAKLVRNSGITIYERVNGSPQ